MRLFSLTLFATFFQKRFLFPQTMSVIQKLRTKYAKLVGALIGVSLVGFILMDAANGPLQSLFGNDTSVAKVNGEKIDNKQYQERLADYETLVPLFSEGKPMDEATRAQIRQQTLDELVYEQLIDDDIQDLGLTVTDAEKKEMFGAENPDPLVQQFPYFKDQETGQFNSQLIAAFEQQVPKITDANQRQKLQNDWATLKRFAVRNRLTQKYNALLMNGVSIPTFALKQAVKETGEGASVRFVKIAYASIPDADVKVTDADLNAYLKAHQAQYTTDQPVRNMEYVSFDIAPSNEDTAASLGTLEKLYNDFAVTDKNETFVNRNSDVQYKKQYISKKNFPSPSADSIFAMPVGSIMGPFYEGGAYQMIKMVDRKQLPDSIKAQHILIAVNQTRDDSAAHKLIDSLKAVALTSGISFDSLATRFSEDPGSKEKGGNLGYFAQGQMVPEFNEAALNGKPGELQTVKTQFGWHLIKVNDQKDFQPAVQLAIVAKMLQPSQATNDAAYSKANNFASKAEGNNFAKELAAKGLQKKVADGVKSTDFALNGVGPARDMVRWLWDPNTEVGAVSQPFPIEGQWIVARYASKQDAGLMALDATLKPQIEAMVKAQKKADLIVEKYKGVKTLEEAAAKSLQPILQADSFTIVNPFAPNIGFEPKVVGYAFYDGLKPGATSPALKGNEGVFFISPVMRYNLPTDPNMMQQQRMSTEMQTRQTLGTILQQSLRKGATIKYNPKGM